MNRENIAALTAMLGRAGFGEGMGGKIARRMCFEPGSFVLRERLGRQGDILTCTLHFDRRGGEYVCDYYDAALLKGIVVPERVVNGVELKPLDQAMMAIDWGAESGDEESIEEVVLLLNRLSGTKEGKHFGDALKIKYWSDPEMEELVGNLAALRSRYEISQRVYFLEGDAIPVDDAYRFLLNRWVEKRMAAKRREGKDAERDNTEKEKVPGKVLTKKADRKGGRKQSIK